MAKIQRQVQAPEIVCVQLAEHPSLLGFGKL
jgi:hypothetical protein